MQLKSLIKEQKPAGLANHMEYKDIVSYDQNISTNHARLNHNQSHHYAQRKKKAIARWVCIKSDSTQENLTLSWISAAKGSADGILIMVEEASLHEETQCKITSAQKSLRLFNMREGSRISKSQQRDRGFFLPRNLVKKLGLDTIDLTAHEERPNCASGKLLKRHIFNLHENLDRMTVIEIQQLVAPTLALINATLKPTSSPRSSDEANMPYAHDQSPLTDVQQFIDKNLFNEDLSPDVIARETGHSRASLYRLCEPLGGIHRYIKSRRLNHAFKCLTGENSPPSSMTNLAFDLGFGSESTFRRAFKEAFGMTPKNARDCDAGLSLSL